MDGDGDDDDHDDKKNPPKLITSQMIDHCAS